MPRKLKTYQTSQGFYDLAIAAPSMKAALEAWGASSNLFHQGFAKESDDSEVIAAAMEKPGIVLRRPVGSNSAFSEHSDLPSAASLDAPRRTGARPEKVKPVKERKIDDKAERRAAAAFEKEQRRREKQREKEEAAAEVVRARRKAAMEKAEKAIEDAEREHEEAVAAIEKDLAAVQRRADAEQERWEKHKERLDEALRKASR
jgi:colicin import membrane protein